MPRVLIGLLLGLGLVGCVPIQTGTSQTVPFELIPGRTETITAGQSWYFVKRYDQNQWMARIVYDPQGRLRSRSIRATGTPGALTWSQDADEVLQDFADSRSLFSRCGGVGAEYVSWPTWFYVMSAQLPPDWKVETARTNGVLQCDLESREFSGLGPSRLTILTIPFSTFYRFTYVLQVPSDAQPGTYNLRWTVFDRHQAKSVSEEARVVVKAP